MGSTVKGIYNANGQCVNALAMATNGTDLYVGGNFSKFGGTSGTTVNNIARYDTAHGLPRRDVLGRKKGLLTKHWFPNVPFGRVLGLAISDFKANHESYVRIFEEN